TMMTCHLSIRPAATCTVPRTQLLAASRRHVAASYWTAASNVAPTSARSSPSVNDGQRRRPPVNGGGSRCTHQAAYNNRNFFKKVNTAKEKVNTVRPNSAVLNAVRENKGKVVKSSACWVWRPIKLNSASIVLKKHTYIDARGRFKSEFDGGYVAFRGGAKGGKITRKGTIKTGNLDFKDMYFVKEL
nr:hypothetical protein [Tanacetum cinerariifolium]